MNLRDVRKMEADMDAAYYKEQMASVITLSDYSYDEILLGHKAYDNHFTGSHSKDVELKYTPWEAISDDERAVWCFVAMGVIETAVELGLVERFT